jgi:L,D-transpeptidase-like protein/putative peptidoglycan binding protein
VLKPLVPGQTAVVRFYRRGHRLQAAQLPLAPSPTGQSAFATFSFTSRTPGRILVRATHFATPQLGTLKARAVGVSVVSPSARPGSRGPIVRLLQGQLARLGYVVGRPGLYDARTARAVLAFRKVTGMQRTEIASSDVFRRLAAGGGVFRVRFPGHGKHVEADLSRQVIALIRAGKVERIYPVSSAKGMFMSSYFIRGYAIHGYPSVPVFPASHGCLRVPNAEAVSIYNWLSIGDIVDVYS